MTPSALTIAGTDPTSGAGIQADIRVFEALGAYPLSIVASITAQNISGVAASYEIAGEVVAKQLDCLLAEISPRAAKTGAIGSSSAVMAIAQRAASWAFPLVVDPVFRSTNNLSLFSESATESLVRALLPLTYLVTPNIPEAEILANMAISTADEMRIACEKISMLGPKNVLIKGGHLRGNPQDVLLTSDEFFVFSNERLNSQVHGTGCILSAAITAKLALGESLLQAVESAREFTKEAIEKSFPPVFCLDSNLDEPTTVKLWRP